MSEKIIYVYADWFDGGPKLMGTLYAEPSRGEETYSFSYDSALTGKGNAASILLPR